MIYGRCIKQHTRYKKKDSNQSPKDEKYNFFSEKIKNGGD